MITHYINLDIYTNKIHKEMWFLIVNIRKEEILYGYPWLATFHPEFNWREGHICHKFLLVELQSTNPWFGKGPAITPLWTEEKQLIVSQLEEECHICTMATDLAIEATQHKEEVQLPNEYQWYAAVFSKEELQHFPLKQSWDLAIDFKAGVPDAIDCHIYPMTQKEDEALDVFIDKELAKGYIQPSYPPMPHPFSL